MNKNKRGDSSILDEFYTKPEIAIEIILCIEEYYRKPIGDWKLVVEPSAGNGGFFKHLPIHNRIGYDINPQADGIIETDFLSLSRIDVCGDITPSDVLIIGNPPFGKNASKARRFLEHALSMSDHVAFIVPKSFQKTSTQNWLSLHTDTHLMLEKPVTYGAFVYRGKTKDMPCVFHLWRRMPNLPKRQKILMPECHPDFCFIRPTEYELQANNLIFAIQRVGHRAGMIITDLTELINKHTSKNFYFIQARHEQVLFKMRLLDLEHLPEKFLNAGMPSISKAELITAYTNEGKPPKLVECLCLACKQ